MADYYNELQEKTRSATDETPKQAIRRVREQTCFAALRIIIGVVVAPGYLSAVLVVFSGFLGVDTSSRLGIALPPIAGLIVALVIFILTLATHQALRLLVDIADLLIEQVRHK